ncbi:unnamed protein product [Effrenium voratum]|nr:unnamed protein product [Effrenium voratum]
MSLADPDFWTCAADGGWHSMREMARFMMYEETSPVRTSLARLAGLLPIWQSRATGLTDGELVRPGQRCPAGEIFFMLLDIIVVNTGLMRDQLKPKDDNIIDTAAVLKTLQVLQVRAPSYEAVLSSGWPLFGMLVILQEGLFRLGRLAAHQSRSLLGHWGDMATVCQEALPLHGFLMAWLNTESEPGAAFLPLLPPGARHEATALKQRIYYEDLCGQDPSAVAAARLVSSGLLPEAKWNVTGWRQGYRRLSSLLDHALVPAGWGRLLFSGWPLLAILHRLQEAYVREALCSDVEPYAYAIPSVADPLSVWVCVRRRADIVDERWRMEGSFPDCGHIVRATREISTRPCYFIDVGANLGGCALMLGRDGHEVLAIEAVPALASLLKASVLRNGLTNVEVLQVAVGGRSAQQALHCSEGHSAICHVLPETDEQSVKVATVTLDSLVSAACAVKIDVEGSEYEVLKGATKILQSHPHLFLELHPYELRERWSSSADVFDIILENGYDTFESPGCTAALHGDLWKGNGTYGHARWARGAILVPGVQLPPIPGPCDCERECHLRLLPDPSRSALRGNCRCWDFDPHRELCTLYRSCGTGLGDALEVAPGWFAGELSGNWHISFSGKRNGCHGRVLGVNQGETNSQLRISDPAVQFGGLAEPDGRQLAMTYLDIHATPDMSVFADEAQVARGVAATLSILGEDVTPEQLLKLLHTNLLQSQAIFGCAIAFEPDSYPWNSSSGSVSPQHPALSSGVSSGNGSTWANLTEPWTLPQTELWHGEKRVLYGPYVTQTGISMDLANAYNYFGPNEEWYHACRSHFLEGGMEFLTGMWGSPYFDEGAGNIEMVTYSVPFTRSTPVPKVTAPAGMDLPFGMPENRKLQTPLGEHFFWGVATVDIDLNMIKFRCGTGQVFDAGRNRCKMCPLGTRMRNSSCEVCEEYQGSVEDRSECLFNVFYLIHALNFHFWLALGLISLGSRIQHNFYLLQVSHEKGGLVLHFCNKHCLHLSTNRAQQLPTLRVHLSGCRLLDKPARPLKFKVVGESQVLIVCEEENKEMFNIDEMCNIAGYARFPLWWELMHITFCRIPMLLYFLLMLAIILSVMLLWVFSGVSLVTVLASTGCVLVVSVLVVLAIRKARAATAHSKQRRRKELLAEKELIQKFSEACWEANQQLEHEARVALLHVGWTEEDLDELTYRTLKCQSQEAGVSVAYLLSDPFLNLARVRSKETNPSFYTLKDVFFFGDDPIGKNIPCPRDGRLGCALVDTLPRHHRQQCTHYLSWTWKYTVGTVQDALDFWLEETQLNSRRVFLYMCFFVNNQYRILYECDGAGSANLEDVFEATLNRIGEMVAILDDWRSPVYLTRIWTIFEQFTAIKLGDVPVTIVLPSEQNGSLISQIREGEDGILQVTQSLCAFESANATAFSPQDERKVKSLIEDTIGFEEVDSRIKTFMLDWVGNVVQEYMKSLMSRSGHLSPVVKKVRSRNSRRRSDPLDFAALPDLSI